MKRELSLGVEFFLVQCLHDTLIPGHISCHVLTSVGSLHFNHFSIYWLHGQRERKCEENQLILLLVSNCMLGQERETKSSKNLGGFLKGMFVFS